jgi:hypothetical protein
VIAAGAVPLALAAIVIELRMTQWSLGPRFAVVALVAALLLTMAWLAPLESGEPRAYHSVLLVAGLLPLGLALVLLAEILGANRPPGSGGFAWTFAVEAGIAFLSARRANSGACTLIAALAGAVTLEAFVAWAFQPHGVGTFRAMLVVLALVYIAGAVRLRDRRRRHGVQLVNTAGVVTLLLAVSFLIAPLAVTAISFGGTTNGAVVGASFGWKLYTLAIGFGLLAYAGVDHEPGPAYIGTAVVLVFALLVGLPQANRGSLVGWPLFLLVIGAAGLAIGLRPREPLPPEPPRAPRVPAPTVPLSPESAQPPTVPLRPVDDEQ